MLLSFSCRSTSGFGPVPRILVQFQSRQNSYLPSVRQHLCCRKVALYCDVGCVVLRKSDWPSSLQMGRCAFRRQICERQHRKASWGRLNLASTANRATCSQLEYLADETAPTSTRKYSTCGLILGRRDVLEVHAVGKFSSSNGLYAAHERTRKKQARACIYIHTHTHNLNERYIDDSTSGVCTSVRHEMAARSHHLVWHVAFPCHCAITERDCERRRCGRVAPCVRTAPTQRRVCT